MTDNYITASLVLENSVVVVTPDGKTHNITDSHLNYGAIREALRTKEYASIPTLIDISKSINMYGNGKVEVKDGVIYCGGQQIHNVVTVAILRMMKEGFDVNPMVNFLQNLMENPTPQAVTELYTFLEKGHFTITPDGCFLAYKRVNSEYKDIHSGNFDNSVGAVVEELRSLVDPDRNATCSRGLHFCSMSYLPHYGSAANGDRVVIVKINPRDVVSIPKDYNDAKGRCCRYEVIGEHTGPDTDDLLGRRAVMSERDFGVFVDDDSEHRSMSDHPFFYNDGLTEGVGDGQDCGATDASEGKPKNAELALVTNYTAYLTNYGTSFADGYRVAFRKAYDEAYDETMSDRPAEEPLLGQITDDDPNLVVELPTEPVEPAAAPRKLYTRPDSRFCRLVGYATAGQTLYVYVQEPGKSGHFEKYGIATGEERGDE